jgi:hypothetical protein
MRLSNFTFWKRCRDLDSCQYCPRILNTDHRNLAHIEEIKTYYINLNLPAIQTPKLRPERRYLLT